MLNTYEHLQLYCQWATALVTQPLILPILRVKLCVCILTIDNYSKCWTFADPVTCTVGVVKWLIYPYILLFNCVTVCVCVCVCVCVTRRISCLEECTVEPRLPCPSLPPTWSATCIYVYYNYACTCTCTYIPAHVQAHIHTYVYTVYNYVRTCMYAYLYHIALKWI